MADSPDDRTPSVWVLDTETKGTGANMVPLERALKQGSGSVPGFTLPARLPAETPAPAPRKPYRFRVVDLMTRRALADDVDARRAVEALEGVRSIVDVSVSVWEEEHQRWRRLTFGETKGLWEHRGSLPAGTS